uniref:Uncharacterized protein n=1 Tax=Anguilla anguilla TaxID=7936 RepID=A0A0E9PLW3_ANGAN
MMFFVFLLSCDKKQIVRGCTPKQTDKKLAVAACRRRGALPNTES